MTDATHQSEPAFTTDFSRYLDLVRLTARLEGVLDKLEHQGFLLDDLEYRGARAALTVHFERSSITADE